MIRKTETDMELKCIKTIPSHSGMARFYAECVGDGVGYLARSQVAAIPSPYRHSPVVNIEQWNGKDVVVFEVSHRKFKVFEVPAGMTRYATGSEAEAAFVAANK
jgi:hypothetical protein